MTNLVKISIGMKIVNDAVALMNCSAEQIFRPEVSMTLTILFVSIYKIVKIVVGML